MRFIGSKVNLLEDIELFINENIPHYKDLVFCDIFSGSAAVGRYFKKEYEIISNDNMYFSYILQKSTIETNKIPEFADLKKELKKKSLNDILNFLEKEPLDDLQEQFKIKDEELFILNNYTPNENCERMYFTPEIGKRIDLIRILIEKWYKEDFLNEEEYYYLLGLLLEAVPFYSNISGIYGAYLKHWDKRAFKEFEFPELEICDNKKDNKSYNKDAHELIREIKGNILYLDPPYNHRQYVPNYHVLETIAHYDYPEIKGVTGMRDYSNQVSKFCRKKEVYGALEDIVSNADFNFIVMSYSTDGILTEDEIEEIFKKYGNPETFKKNRIKYRKYKSKQKQKSKDLKELLFFIELKPMPKDAPIKKIKKETQTTLLGFGEETVDSEEEDKKVNAKKETKSKAKNENKKEKTKKGTKKPKTKKKEKEETKKFLKSPFNYIGGKHKIMPQIYPNFPKEISTFVDLFGGGFNVGINIDADKIIYNDQITPLVDLFQYLNDNEYEDIINYIESRISEFDIKMEEKEGFLEFREYYNKNSENPLDLYVLIAFSFNYQIRYNNSGEYNCPHGTNRSHFSKNMKNRLEKFVNEIHEKDISFYNKDFTDLDLVNKLDEDSLVYCDPPYLITTGSYNDGNRGFKNWTLKEEQELLDLLDELNENGIKFALSNVIRQGDKSNDLLINWIEKNNYKAINIDSDYSNSNYKKKEKNKIAEEVLIINY